MDSIIIECSQAAVKHTPMDRIREKVIAKALTMRYNGS